MTLRPLVLVILLFAGLWPALAAFAASPGGPPPWTGAAFIKAATITNTAGGTKLIDAAPSGRLYLSIVNESDPATGAFLACAFGAVPAINTGGSFTFAPLGGQTWEGSWIPSDQVNCICSAASCAVTFIAFPA